MGDPTVSMEPQRARLAKYLVALLAVAVWAVLRLLPGDITPEVPEALPRGTPPRPPSPRLAWARPQPFPTYDPGAAWGLLDHLDQGTVRHRQAPDVGQLQQDIRKLQDQLWGRWLSASGGWRITGEGVLSCLIRPSEADLLAAALRPPLGEPVRGVQVRVRWLTPPRPKERVGLTGGLDARGSGSALLVGCLGREALTCELVEVKEFWVSRALAQKAVPAEAPPQDGPGPWLTLELVQSDVGCRPWWGGSRYWRCEAPTPAVRCPVSFS